LVGLAHPEEVSGASEKGGKDDASGEATLMRKRMERDRGRREKREQVAGWLREVVLGKCWL
jgi:hypothetical protein